MAWEKLTEARLEEVLTAYKADIPLGMIREENDFRISVALDSSLVYTGAHNVYYVKWRGVTRKSLVIYVKTEKALSPMPFIVYVVHFYCNYKQATNITAPPFSFHHPFYQSHTGIN